MSKHDQENQSDAQETIVESPSGAINMQESNMTPNDLLRINVNDHVEKKNNLSYLSWAWAWAEVLKVDHKATFEV